MVICSEVGRNFVFHFSSLQAENEELKEEINDLEYSLDELDNENMSNKLKVN